MRVFLFQSVFFAVLFFAQTAMASSGQTDNHGRFQWEGKDYRSCGQGCLSKVGAYHVAFGAEYQIQRVHLIERSLEKAQTSDEERDIVIDNISEYCLPQDFRSKDFKGCFRRFKAVVLSSIPKMVHAMEEMGRTAASYRLDRERAVLKNQEPEKLAIHPSFQTAEELIEQGKEDRERLEQLISDENYKSLAKSAEEEMEDQLKKELLDYGLALGTPELVEHIEHINDRDLEVLGPESHGALVSTRNLFVQAANERFAKPFEVESVSDESTFLSSASITFPKEPRKVDRQTSSAQSLSELRKSFRDQPEIEARGPSVQEKNRDFFVKYPSQRLEEAAESISID